MSCAASPVLLVEDDLALCDYLAAALRAAGFTVTLAHDRLQALERLVDGQVVLLDLGLPPHPNTMIEGLALLVQGLHRSPDSKFIVLTGQAQDTAALEAVRRGAFDFLVKPATLEIIFAALHRAQLFVREEALLTRSGETRLQLTARLDEGPREAACHAEEQLLRRVLADTSYNVTESARRLGMSREHVYYYLNKYGIRRPA